ncbi:shikimate dehydrogenase [Brunnivagina elsteri]|uniref:Shikimate dehydrogenase (NADP(+)) n=1 Tax=Brunnivagina elsteri CCALA 953 TaxID=987040 RepID=A0A2A2TCG1_9CYAN|nr:shikimate dehydrogenase [Calothrix elsteri]PAX51109.1 shikimate dehydrogenase [Calothrix elsteri CCALA 953]
MITGTTKLLGVIGHPVEHSLSPLMHNAAISQMGIDYVYLPFAIAPENLAAAIKGFEAIGVVGFSVTIPHKQAIMAFLSEISVLAEAIGAVNTVVRKNNQWVGTNTDVEGFIAPLRSQYNRDWSQTTAVILGNGGAARAVVAGCVQLGCAEIHVVGRNFAKLETFRDSWANSSLKANLQTHQWELLPKLLPHADLLVNTTPIGMYPNIQESPLSEEEIEKLNPNSPIVYDLIYTPNPTKLLQQTQKIGAIAIDGLEMLVQQGAAALKIWCDRETIPVDIMRQTLIKHLRS